MFGKKQRRNGSNEIREAEERFVRNERVGTDISTGIAKLKSLPRRELPDAAFMLLMAAKRQSERIREAVRDDLGQHPASGGASGHDAATFQAQEAVHGLREHHIAAQTFFEWLSEQSAEARFSVPQHDAVSLVAAMMREQRLEGILEGLRLAGLLNEVRSQRQDGAETNELRQGDV